MKLTRQEEISVLLVGALADTTDGYVSLSQIASLHQISPHFLKKIARLLKISGIIKSKEGVDGGYSLAKPQTEIRVIDIFTAVTSKNITPMPSYPIGHKHICPIFPTCLPQKIHMLIQRTLTEYLSDLTIDQFVAKK